MSTTEGSQPGNPKVKNSRSYEILNEPKNQTPDRVMLYSACISSFGCRSRICSRREAGSCAAATR